MLYLDLSSHNMAQHSHSNTDVTAPAAPPRPIFEKIDSDEVITQLTVGKEQVWAVNRMGALFVAVVDRTTVAKCRV